MEPVCHNFALLNLRSGNFACFKSDMGKKNAAERSPGRQNICLQLSVKYFRFNPQ